MISTLMPEECFQLVSHHLPREQPVGPRGGRPPIPNRTVLKVVWYILASGCRWQDLPPEIGCSGRTAYRRLQHWEKLGIWDHLHADLLRLLQQADSLSLSATGSEQKIGQNAVGKERTI